MSDLQKVVVTGGAGFIGSHVVEYWSSQNAEVHVIDNYRSGYRKNIASFENVHIHEGSITNRKLVLEVLQGADYVHNFAAMVSVPESIEKPYDCVDINVNGILHILEAAKIHKVKKVIHSSSAAVYGENPVSPKTTNLLPDPKSPYGITKLDGEYYARIYKEQFGVNTISLRYFNVFGERQDPGSAYAAAIPIFVSKALKNEPLTIYGDGTQTRDFIYVKDVVGANILAARREDVSGVYNIACNKAISILQLAELIIEVIESKSEILFEPERPGDIKHSLASIDDSTDKLGFVPSYNLHDGLVKTIKYFADLKAK